MRFLLFILTSVYSIPSLADDPPVQYEQENELTDSIFPRTNPNVIGLIYRMLEAIDKLFTKYDIPYWIDGGTALGAVRHQGCIPWDDDADLVFHIEDKYRILALRREFAKFGFHLEQTDIIRLFPSPQKRYPYVDLAGYRLFSDNAYRFDLKGPREKFYKFYWLPEEVDTLVRVRFGPLMLNAPSDILRYIFTGYGTDCLTHATFQTPHDGPTKNLRIQQKVRIVDFSPAAYENFYIPLDKPLY